MAKTIDEVKQYIEENDVEFIRLQFTDVLGQLKNVAITKSQLIRALDNKVMFDGSSIDGFVRIEESDMYLRPDLDTFTVLPWRPQEGRVARLICDIYDPEGYPFEGDSRYQLKLALEEARELGYTFCVGPECEFFVFHTDDVGLPTTLTHDTGGYFDLESIDLGGEVRRKICLSLEEMGFEIEASHHEVAPGQHEIDFHYEEALKAADDIMTFKLAVKVIAKQKGLFATFMPKPVEGVAGSGMHLNMSLYKDGNNVFYDRADPRGNGLSETAYYFIAGIMNHIKGMTLLANPLVNSYKRLVEGYEAPVHIAWACRNRSPLIRIPAVRGSRTHIELRSPDSTANPYLILAACLQAGLEGIRNQEMPPEPVTNNVYEMTQEELEKADIEILPKTLDEAIKEIEKDELVKEAIGSHIYESLKKIKKKEWKEYSASVSSWEMEKYLKNY